MFRSKRVDSIRERLTIAELVEEAAAESASDGGEDLGSEAVVVVAGWRGECECQGGLRFVARFYGFENALWPNWGWDLGGLGHRQFAEFTGDCGGDRIRINITHDTDHEWRAEQHALIPVADVLGRDSTH